MANVGRLLLTYEATDEIVDKSFVIDWSHRERVLGGHRDDLGKEPLGEIPYEDLLSAEKAYWASKLPLAEYIERPEKIDEFSLPEVITLFDVPSSIIAVADTQPQLHDMSPLTRESVLRRMADNPELEVLSAYIT